MAFTYFVNSTTADAMQMMNNYYYIADGDQMPLTQSAAGTVASSHNTCNLGASTTVYKSVYCSNLNIYASTASADKSIWKLIYHYKGDNTSLSSLEITGLDGDSSRVYFLEYNDYSAPSITSLIFNGDSASNYGFQEIKYYTGSSVALRGSGTSIKLGGGDSASTIFTKILIYAKSGNERLGLQSIFNFWQTTGAYKEAGVYERAIIWNNTANNLTSMKIYGGINGKLMNLYLWGRG